MRDVNPETITRTLVVVQDLATQWILSYPCKTKILTRDGKSLFE